MGDMGVNSSNVVLLRTKVDIFIPDVSCNLAHFNIQVFNFLAV